MSKKSARRPLALDLLVVAMVFQGFSGVAGGFGLTFDPSGASLGIPRMWLEGSPFSSYLIPGLVLLIVLGAGPLIVGWGLWRRRPWAKTAAPLVGAALVVWIAVEIAVIGYHSSPPLQAIYGPLGVVMLVLGLLRSVRGALSG